MKIAMFAPMFLPPGGTFNNYFEYWQKSAASNCKIDFFVPTNIDTRRYKDYSNIHFISMTDEEFWEKIEAVLGFRIARGYYKTAELRPFFGIVFKDILKDYDYWGSTEFDVIYGDIFHFVQPYLDQGEKIIGKHDFFRLIKNTDEMREMPFRKVTGMSYPLTLEKAFSTNFCWYFGEFRGMGIRYFQAGVHEVSLNDYLAQVKPGNTFFECNFMPGKWNFKWNNGKLIGNDEKGNEKEFLLAHFQKRKLETSESSCDGNVFYIIPNEITSLCDGYQYCEKSILYNLKWKNRVYKNAIKDQRLVGDEGRRIWEEIYAYCKQNGLGDFEDNNSAGRRIKDIIKRMLIWKL